MLTFLHYYFSFYIYLSKKLKVLFVGKKTGIWKYFSLIIFFSYIPYYFRLLLFSYHLTSHYFLFLPCPFLTVFFSCSFIFLLLLFLRFILTFTSFHFKTNLFIHLPTCDWRQRFAGEIITGQERGAASIPGRPMHCHYLIFRATGIGRPDGVLPPWCRKPCAATRTRQREIGAPGKPGKLENVHNHSFFPSLMHGTRSRGAKNCGLCVCFLKVI